MTISTGTLVYPVHVIEAILSSSSSSLSSVNSSSSTTSSSSSLSSVSSLSSSSYSSASNSSQSSKSSSSSSSSSVSSSSSSESTASSSSTTSSSSSSTASSSSSLSSSSNSSSSSSPATSSSSSSSPLKSSSSSSTESSSSSLESSSSWSTVSSSSPVISSSSSSSPLKSSSSSTLMSSSSSSPKTSSSSSSTDIVGFTGFYAGIYCIKRPKQNTEPSQSFQGIAIQGTTVTTTYTYAYKHFFYNLTDSEMYPGYPVWGRVYRGGTVACRVKFKNGDYYAHGASAVNSYYINGEGAYGYQGKTYYKGRTDTAFASPSFYPKQYQLSDLRYIQYMVGDPDNYATENFPVGCRIYQADGFGYPTRILAQSTNTHTVSPGQPMTWLEFKF